MKKIKDLSEEIIQKMLNNQEAQGNKRDISVFEKDITAGVLNKGFSWYNTEEGASYWAETLCENKSEVILIEDSNIDHPSHYGGKDNPFEAIKVIEAYNLNFNLGNTIKYILRADKKGNKKQDLEKAVWYLQREINKL